MERLEQKSQFEFLVVNRGTGKCMITLIGNPHATDGKDFIVVMTQLSSQIYQGISVTNAVELIAYQYFVTLSVRWMVQPESVLWIEHYPKEGSFDESFDEVIFQGDKFTSPKWTRLANDCQYIREVRKLVYAET